MVSVGGVPGARHTLGDNCLADGLVEHGRQLREAVRSVLAEFGPGRLVDVGCVLPRLDTLVDLSLAGVWRQLAAIHARHVPLEFSPSPGVG